MASTHDVMHTVATRHGAWCNVHQSYLKPDMHLVFWFSFVNNYNHLLTCMRQASLHQPSLTHVVLVDEYELHECVINMLYL